MIDCCWHSGCCNRWPAWDWEQSATYSSLVPVGWALLIELGVFLSLAVVPLEALIHHHLQAAMLLSHLQSTSAV